MTPETLDELHQTGCIPSTWPQPGPNQITNLGTPGACDGQPATLIYDRADGTITTQPVDLGSSYTVDPAELGCGRTQIDLFVGDVRDAIHTPGWNPAHKLITVNWADGTNCAPPVTTTSATTPPPPATAPTTTTTTPQPGTTCPAGSYLTVTFSELPGSARLNLNSEPVQVDSAIPVWRAVFPFTANTTVTVVDGPATAGCYTTPTSTTTGPPPELPATGVHAGALAISGGLFVLAGTLICGLAALRQHARRTWQ